MNNSKPPIEEKKFVCPHCGADWADSTMIGDPEYNDMWKCNICNEEYGSAKMITPTYKGEVPIKHAKGTDLLDSDLPKYKCQDCGQLYEGLGDLQCPNCESELREEVPTPQLNWEEEFRKLYKQLGLHLGYKNKEQVAKLIDFIHSTILPSERKRWVEEILKCKHWVFTAPYGLEMENGEVVPRKREDGEYIKVDDILTLLSDNLEEK